MENKEYEYQERIRLNKQIRYIESAPIAERREARQDWTEAMKDPANVANRIDWLLDGSYGYGSYIVAREVLTRTRMNRVAFFAQLLAALEYRCPANFARAAWNRLSENEQKAVNAAIGAVIEDAYTALMDEQKESQDPA